MCSAQRNRTLWWGLFFIAPEWPVSRAEGSVWSRQRVTELRSAKHMCRRREVQVPEGRFSAGLAKYKINHDSYRDNLPSSVCPGVTAQIQVQRTD